MRASFKLEGDKDFAFYLRMAAWMKQNISFREHGNWVLRSSHASQDFTEVLFEFMQYSNATLGVLNKIDGILLERGTGWTAWLISYKYFDVEHRRERLYQEAFYEIDDDCYAIMMQLAIFGAQ